MVYLWPRLQLGLRLHQVFNLLKTIKVVEALWIQQRAARLDRLAADDFLDGQLYLFAIDSGLSEVFVSKTQESSTL
jgi:hypothetical protein